MIKTLRTNLEFFILFGLLSLWSLVWDYNHFGSYQRAGREKLLLLAAAAIASLRFAKTWHWSVGLFFLYVSCSFLHFGFSPWGMQVGDVAAVFTVDGMDEILCITACLFLIPEIAKRVTRRAFENTILAAGVVHGVIGALNIAGIYPFLKVTLAHQENLPIGLLGQQTLLGPFMAFAFGVAVIRLIEGERPLERAGCWALAAGLFSIALLTKSSMTAASLIAAGLTITLFHLGVAAVGILACVAGGLIFLASRFDPNVTWHSGRMDPWLNALSLHQLRPWFGFGIGSWEPLAEAIRQAKKEQLPWSYLHSEPLQALLELGRVGAGVILFVLTAAFSRIHFLYIFRDRTKLTYIVGLAVFGVNSLANFTMHIVPLGPLFAYCLFKVLRGYSFEDERLRAGNP